MKRRKQTNYWLRSDDDPVILTEPIEFNVKKKEKEHFSSFPEYQGAQAETWGTHMPAVWDYAFNRDSQ